MFFEKPLNQPDPRLTLATKGGGRREKRSAAARRPGSDEIQEYFACFLVAFSPQQ